MIEWKPLPIDPRYLVSSDGRVRGRRVAELRPGNTPNGYLYVRIYTNKRPRNVLIARAVLEAHVGPPPSRDHQAHHIDGNRKNNHLSNLAWVTPSKNSSEREVSRGRRRTFSCPGCGVELVYARDNGHYVGVEVNG